MCKWAKSKGRNSALHPCCLLRGGNETGIPVKEYHLVSSLGFCLHFLCVVGTRVQSTVSSLRLGPFTHYNNDCLWKNTPEATLGHMISIASRNRNIQGRYPFEDLDIGLIILSSASLFVTRCYNCNPHAVFCSAIQLYGDHLPLSSTGFLTSLIYLVSVMTGTPVLLFI